MTREPAPRPCESCPYRRDVPSGVWAEEEYRRLPEYDKPTAEQPLAVFLCHQGNDLLCGGWLGCHGQQNGPYGLLSLRFLLRSNFDKDWEKLESYESPIPLFSSGQEACDHGLKELDNPGEEAERIALKIMRKHEQ